MRDIAYIDGMFLPIAEAKVPVNDRGYLFGDGLYEVALAFGKHPFALADHLARWQSGLAALRLACPYDNTQIAALIEKGLTQVDTAAELLIYWQLTRGVAPRAHPFPPAGTPGTFLLTIQPYEHDVRGHEQGEAAVLCPDNRWARCDIKSINLLPNVLASQAAVEAGCTQAIFQRDGIVTECAAANAYIVKAGTIITHPLTPAILPGTTRAHLLQLAKELHIPVAERPFSVEELLAADEAFASSAGKRPTPIISVDGKSIGGGTPGPVTRALQKAYQAMIDKACGL